LTTLKTAIADGKAVIISILVYSSFMTLSVFTTGRVPTPKKTEVLLGGHAICLTGYDDATSTFSFVNSWGTYTGIGGRYTITYDYVSDPKYAGEYFSF
jgi:C1A family cysteine protease